MRAYILVLITATALTYTAMAQNLTPDQAQRQLDTNTEPAKVGNAAAKDAAAIRDAKTGWYAEALKTRDPAASMVAQGTIRLFCALGCLFCAGRRVEEPSEPWLCGAHHASR